MNHTKMIRPLTLAIAVSLGVNAEAQQDSESIDLVLEEVIVTAQKREQSLQEVPLTVNAFTGDFVEENGVVDIRDIEGLTPNLSIKSRGETEATVFIRGIGSLAPGIGADPAVGIYIDGMTASRGTNATAAFFDVERIEVVKGPQGTLFGRNASAGAISIITNKPDLEGTSGRVMGGFGNEGQLRGQFVGNWALNDAWAVRIGGNHVSRDGLIDNELTGQDLLDQNSNQVRASLLGLIGDNWETTLMFEAINAKNNDAIFTDADAFADTVRQNPAPRKQELDSTRLLWTNIWGLGSDMDLTSITGYYDHDVWVTPVDADEIEFDIATFIEPQTNTTFSQELRLNGSVGSVDWFLGGSYLTEELGFETDLRYEEGIVLDLLAGLGELCLDPELPECTYQSETPFGENDVTSYALYGDFTWSITDSFRLTVGGRYTRDEKDMFYANPPTDGILGVVDGQIFGPITDGPVFASDSWSNFDPRLAIDWDLGESTTLFASFAQGYKSGGINRQVNTFLPEMQMLNTFDEEVVKSYEIGTKSRFMDGRASLNASLFFNDYEDFQLETFANLLPEVFNVGDVESKGLELEGRFLVTQNFELAGTYAYLDSTIDSSDFEPGLVGNDTPHSPEHSASAQAHWYIDSGIGEWKLSGIWTYSDNYWFDIQNSLEQPSYQVLDLRASLTGQNGNWQIAGFVDNAADEEYFVERFVFLDVANRRAPGRLYRVELSWYF